MSANTQWEYKVVTLGSWRGLKPEAAEAQLNELGQDGWEIFSTHRDSLDRMVAVAKRPLTVEARRRRSYPGEER